MHLLPAALVQRGKPGWWLLRHAAGGRSHGASTAPRSRPHRSPRTPWRTSPTDPHGGAPVHPDAGDPPPIGHLLLAQGERGAAQEALSRLRYDAERLHGPHHPFPEELRRTLYWLSQVQG